MAVYARPESRDTAEARIGLALSRLRGEKVRDIRDQGGAISQELVWPGARRTGHWAGNSSDCAPEFVRMPGDGHRSRSSASFDNDGRSGERNHEPRPSNEAMSRRHSARRDLTDKKA